MITDYFFIFAAFIYVTGNILLIANCIYFNEKLAREKKRQKLIARTKRLVSTQFLQ